MQNNYKINNYKIIKMDDITRTVLYKIIVGLSPNYNAIDLKDAIQDIFITHRDSKYIIKNIFNDQCELEISIKPNYKIRVPKVISAKNYNSDNFNLLYISVAKILNIINLETGAVCKKFDKDQLEIYLKEATPLSYFLNVEEIYI